MSHKLLRVFPRRTSATPTDVNAIVGRGPDMFDEADEVHISVSFEWDIPKAESLARQWERIAPVKIGGPAYGDPGGEFTPRLYLKKGYVITSRGCPNYCWFCRAWKNEGTIRELTIHDGWNLLDNNILACSIPHQTAVFEMLKRQPHRPRLTGGLEAKRLTEWHIEWLTILKPLSYYFAYDTPDDYEPLVEASKLLSKGDLFKNHSVGCYVLIGYKGDTFDKAEERLRDTIALGYMPQSMLYNLGAEWEGEERKRWKRFHREWANKVIVGHKMKGVLV